MTCQIIFGESCFFGLIVLMRRARDVLMADKVGQNSKTMPTSATVRS